MLGVGTTTGATNNIAKGDARSLDEAGVHAVGGDKAKAKSGGDTDIRVLGNL